MFTLLEMKLIYERVEAETDGWDLENIERFATILLVITLIKKKIKFSSYIRKFRTEQLQSHRLLTASSYMEIFAHFLIYILGSPSSYMTLRKI